MQLRHQFIDMRVHNGLAHEGEGAMSHVESLLPPRREERREGGREGGKTEEGQSMICGSPPNDLLPSSR